MKRKRKKTRTQSKKKQDRIDEKERLDKAELIKKAEAARKKAAEVARVEAERLALERLQLGPTKAQEYLDSKFDIYFDKDSEHAYCQDILTHLGNSSYKNELMCHKIAANNALSVLIDRTNQDTDNSLKDNSISTTINQDIELETFHARYHKTDEKLKHIVTHQKYHEFKKSLQNLGENLNPSNQDKIYILLECIGMKR